MRRFIGWTAWLLFCIGIGAASAKQPTLTAFTCPTPVTSGSTSSCTITFSTSFGEAVPIFVSYGGSALTGPGTVTIGAKATSVTLPLTAATVTKATSETITIFADQSKSFKVTVNPGSVPPPVPTLKSITCASNSLTGAGTDACTVSLSGTAPAAEAVSLSSSSASLSVPATVTLPAGALNAAFTASAGAVTTTTPVVLSARLGSTSVSTSVTLNPQTTPTAPAIKLSSTTLPFGNWAVGSPDPIEVIITSNGTAPLIISSITLSGAGFTESGVTTPATLAPGAGAALTVTFTPTAATAYSGTVTLVSNAGTNTITLSGTGTSVTSPAKYQVNLTWTSPAAGTDPAVSYVVFRGGVQIGTSKTTTYSDTTVTAGSYVYTVTSVDASGAQSAPSNSYTATVP